MFPWSGGDLLCLLLRVYLRLGETYLSTGYGTLNSAHCMHPRLAPHNGSEEPAQPGRGACSRLHKLYSTPLHAGRDLPPFDCLQLGCYRSLVAKLPGPFHTVIRAEEAGKHRWQQVLGKRDSRARFKIQGLCLGQSLCLKREGPLLTVPASLLSPPFHPSLPPSFPASFPSTHPFLLNFLSSIYPLLIPIHPSLFPYLPPIHSPNIFIVYFLHARLCARLVESDPPLRPLWQPSPLSIS